ncbi:MAG: tRNA 2-thiocytidine(32) synthetase TtcA [Candidatus Omnitrophica bacterium]|nr:tRNA 2-thiocytidine(32) synthetase TtcA [Candidatus Omnitrophota bacterium]
MKNTKKQKSETAKLERAAYFLSKKVGKAITDYDMIGDGDKILVAVSGGKDSLSLLKILEDRRSFVPVRYDLTAVHVDMGYHCIHPRILAEYFEKSGYRYHIEKVDILKGKDRSSITCFWCSWNRRKALFEAAARFGCNKVALGHHKDDIIETILMNLFFNGEISAMAPKQELFKGKITIIRPLAYLEEKEIIQYNRLINFPHPRCKCPNADTSRRTKVGEMIGEIEKLCPNVKTNVFRALKNIKKEYLL